MFETLNSTPSKQILPALMARLNFIIKTKGTGFLDWNVRTGHTTWDKTWALLFGLPHGLYSGNAGMWEKSIHTNNLPDVMETLNEHLMGETPHFDAKYRLESHCGKSYSIRTCGVIVDKNSLGRPSRMILISQKIAPVSLEGDHFKSVILPTFTSP